MDGISGRKARVQAPVSSPTEKSDAQPQTVADAEAQKPTGWAPKPRGTRPAYMSELESSVLVDSSGHAVVDSSGTPVRSGGGATDLIQVNTPKPPTPNAAIKAAKLAVTATPLLANPKNVDEAFDTLVATASGPAQVRRLTDNVTAWNAKWDLVTKATKTFDFSYFSIERDAYGYAYMGALLAQQMRGVQVTGVTDYMANSRGHGFVSTGLGADYMQELAQYGAKIGIYDTLSTRAKSLMDDGLSYRVLSSDHDKLSVADAGTPQAEGETGGRNVAGAYHQDPKDNPKSWRDDSIQIKGQVADGLVTAMRRELNGSAVTMVKPDLFNLQPHATEMLAAYSMMEAWTRGPALSEAEKAAVRADPRKRAELANALYDQAIAAVPTLPGIPDKVKKRALDEGEQKHLHTWAHELANDLELKGSRPKYDAAGGWVDGEVKIMDQVGAASAAPGQRLDEMAPDMLNLIRGAQKEIVIENPYVVLTESMVKHFAEAADRGVKITIVTNSPESTDSAVTQGFFLNDWKRLEERVPTARIFVATGERKFHSKAFVVDGKVSADTSYNADLLSRMVNGEVGAITRSEPLAQNLLSAISDDLHDPANKFREWSIKRDENGKVVHGADGQPIAVEGPEQDVSKKLQKRYKPVQLLCEWLTHTELGSELDISGNNR